VLFRAVTYNKLLYSITECCITVSSSGLHFERLVVLYRGRHVPSQTSESPELLNLGSSLILTRHELGLSQAGLAARCGLSQAQISYFEVGQRRPTLNQLLQIARALGCSVQQVLTGSDRPGNRLSDIALELRNLGLVDLWVREPIVPGAFRASEEVIALAVSGREPDPRIVEAIPAILAWNDTSPVLLRAYGVQTRPGAVRRLAWLADIALAIENRGGFPGGCRSDLLARFLKIVRIPGGGKADWDDLGRPTAKSPTSPIWKRWRINYEADVSVFEQRARLLLDLQSQSQAAPTGGPDKRSRGGTQVESPGSRTARRSRC
jgi:transcriptional regulator with XRE-family HTH domain